ERKVLDAIAATIEEYGKSGDVSATLGGDQLHASGDEAEGVVCPTPIVESSDWIGGHHADQLAVLGSPGETRIPRALDAKMIGNSDLQPVGAIANRLALGEQEQRSNMILPLEVKVRPPVESTASVDVAGYPEPPVL